MMTVMVHRAQNSLFAQLLRQVVHAKTREDLRTSPLPREILGLVFNPHDQVMPNKHQIDKLLEEGAKGDPLTDQTFHAAINDILGGGTTHWRLEHDIALQIIAHASHLCRTMTFPNFSRARVAFGKARFPAPAMPDDEKRVVSNQLIFLEQVQTMGVDAAIRTIEQLMNNRPSKNTTSGFAEEAWRTCMATAIRRLRDLHAEQYPQDRVTAYDGPRISFEIGQDLSAQDNEGLISVATVAISRWRTED